MVKTITIEEAARNFKHLFQDVNQEANQYIVKSNDQVAVLLPFDEFQSLSERKEEARESFFEMVDKIHKRTKDVPLKEIESAVSEAVAAAKQEELKELE